MRIEISNTVKVYEPTEELQKWCKANLIVSNPEYAKKFRMKLWLGDTPEHIWLYEIDAGALILPYGVLSMIPEMFKGCKITHDFAEIRAVDYKGDIPLYPYQKEAVDELLAARMGVLQSKAGSGKTQMGLALVAKLGCKTLWLTYTHDLLNQSRDRAAQYFDSSLFGEITRGKVNIGKGITFATVQTLAKQDLTRFKHTWDCVIVDECHRVAGTPTSLTQFGKVLSAISCKHKYGLSATVHRADGLTKCIFTYLGNIAYSVPDEEVADKVMTVFIERRDTGITVSPKCLDTDGTLIYAKLVNYLAGNTRRNFYIVNDLVENAYNYNLILSDRLQHLRLLMSYLPDELQELSVMIDGKMTTKKARAAREQAIEDMRNGKKRFLFATYRLAKEGLDIPRLDRLYLTTPQKDYAVVVQSVGRIARTFEGKDLAVCYDYVDSIDYLVGAYKQRCRHYRKSGCSVSKS